MVMGVPALGVRQRQPMAEVRQFAVPPRPKQQMPMIGHQAIRQQAHAGNVLQSFTKNTLEGFKVGVLGKHAQPPIGPIQNVVHVTAQRRPQWSSHTAITYPQTAALSRKRFLTPFLPPGNLFCPPPSKSYSNTVGFATRPTNAPGGRATPAGRGPGAPGAPGCVWSNSFRPIVFSPSGGGAASWPTAPVPCLP